MCRIADETAEFLSHEYLTCICDLLSSVLKLKVINGFAVIGATQYLKRSMQSRLEPSMSGLTMKAEFTNHWPWAGLRL